MDFISGHAGVMGQNFMVSVLCFMVAFYMFRLFWRTDRHDHQVRMLSLGIACVAIYWAIHRGWWYLWRFELSIGNDDAAAWFKDNADFLLILLPLAGFSYLVHLLPWSKALLGRWSWPVSVVLCICLYFIGAAPGVIGN